MLRIWLNRCHVARWWGDADPVLAMVRERSPHSHALITVEGQPVGYICWQNLQPTELAAAGLAALPFDLIDVDILVGEPDIIGRGVGPQALRLLLNRLQVEGVSCVGLAAEADNQRALRAYAKAGFQPYKRFNEAGHDMCYLVHTFD